jgi:hypothetical protein
VRDRIRLVALLPAGDFGGRYHRFDRSAWQTLGVEVFYAIKTA